MSHLVSFTHRAAVLAFVTLAAAGSAHAVDISTGSYSKSQIGAEFDSPYDNFVVTGASRQFDWPQASTTVNLGSYSFEVGPNCYSCSLTPSFDANIALTVDGITKQFDLPYSWSSTGPNDTLSFGSAAPLMFDFGSRGFLTFALEDVALLTASGGFVRGDLNAVVTTSPVPEPGTTALMMSGLIAMAFIARRRRRSAARATFSAA